MLNMQVLASQLTFLTNRDAELAALPIFWPINCIKNRKHVTLLSGPTVYSLYCDGNFGSYLQHIYDQRDIPKCTLSICVFRRGLEHHPQLLIRCCLLSLFHLHKCHIRSRPLISKIPNLDTQDMEPDTYQHNISQGNPVF